MLFCTRVLGWVLPALVVSIVRLAAAQTSPRPSVSLSLDEVARRARSDAPSVLQAFARLRGAEAQVYMAQTPLLPTLSASATGSAFVSNGSFVSSAGVPSTNATTVAGWGDVTGNFRWTLWDFGRTALAVRAARSGVSTALQNRRAAESSAVLLAASLYFTVLGDRELIASATETVRQRQRQFEISSGMVEAGSRPPIERTRADVALSAALLDLTAAEANYRADSALLAVALALDPVMPIEVIPGAHVAVIDDLALAAAAAEAHRPEVLAAQRAVDEAEAGLVAARAGTRPSLFTTASAGARYTERLGIPGALSEQGSVNIGLTVPLYDPTLSANVRAAAANVAAARATEAMVRAQARGDAVQAAVQAHAAGVALEQSEALARGAAANLQQAEGRYAAGAGTLLEIVDAQAADATARVAVVRARWQVELAALRLLGVVGGLDRLGATPIGPAR